MLHTLNLSTATRASMRAALHALAIDHEVKVLMVGQHGAFLFIKASQYSAARNKFTAPRLIAAVEDALHMLNIVGYIPLVLPYTVDQHHVVEARARAIGKRAHLDEMEATISHRTITWNSGTDFEDGSRGPRTGILRQRQPYLLFQVKGEELELVATANPADASYAPKWIRAAQRWRSLDPTRVKAGAA